MSGDGEQARTGQLYKTVIVGDIIKYIGRGHFIIPIKFYASNITNKVVYVKFFWDSDVFSDESSVLDYNILSYQDFQKYKIVTK